MTKAVWRPWLDPTGVCKGCGTPMEAEHRDTCWVADTIEYVRSGQTIRVDDELTRWWVDLARTEAGAVVPKAIEYGATDLVEIGRTLLQAMGTEKVWQVPDEVRAELGVYFYVVGKMARWTDAVKTGRRVSDDTLHDIGVYIRMAQRIREKGSWPGVKLEENKSVQKIVVTHGGEGGGY